MEERAGDCRAPGSDRHSDRDHDGKHDFASRVVPWGIEDGDIPIEVPPGTTWD